MSARPDELPPLEDEVRAYVDAFAAVERPRHESVARGLQALRASVEVEERRRRRVWTGAALLAAVLVGALWRTLVWVGDKAEPETAVDMQAPYEGKAAPSGGQAVGGSASGKDRESVVVEETGPSATEREAVQGSASREREDAAVPRTRSRRNDVTPRSRGGAATPQPLPKEDETPVSDSRSRLAEEVELFREIKQALTANRFADALSLAEKHASRFPGGAFALEREVARARALCELGRKADARQVSEAFLKKNPRSHLATQMRAICE